jgi:hypothetical protein
MPASIGQFSSVALIPVPPETCLSDMKAIETQLIAGDIVKGGAPSLDDAVNDR